MTSMTRDQIDQLKGRIFASTIDQDVYDLLEYVKELEYLLDEADQEDFYGTEGWRHNLGLE